MKVASKNDHFIHADIVVLVGKYVVVILFEYWSAPTTPDHYGHIFASSHLQ